MKGSVRFFLSEDASKYKMHKVAELNEILNGIGISFEIEDQSLSIKYDTEIIWKKINRNAGSKRKYIGYFRADDIRRRMSFETAEEIAASLGISRSTLFRRLKKAEEQGEDAPL